MSDTGLSAAAQAGNLADLIDDALEQLAVHDVEMPALDAAHDAPLPSLLAQCEDLLSELSDNAPCIRLIASPGPIDQVTRREIERQPNAALVDTMQFVPAIASGTSGQLPHPLDERDQISVGSAALTSMLNAHFRKGLRPVILVDLLEQSDWRTVLAMIEGVGLELHCVLLTCHPLRNYLIARHRNLLRSELNTLEAYCEICGEFLDRIGNVPTIKLEDLAHDTVQFALELRKALNLGANFGFPAEDGTVLDPIARSVLYFPDGAFAIEESLEGERYKAVCNRLGYQVDQLIETNDISDSSTLRLDQPCPSINPRASTHEHAYIGGMLTQFAAAIEQPHVPSPPSIGLGSLISLIEECLNSGNDVLDSLDHAAQKLPVRDRALFTIASAAHFAAAGDRLLAENMLTEAEHLVQVEDRQIQLLIANVLCILGQEKAAVQKLVHDALLGPMAMPDAVSRPLRNLLEQLTKKDITEHGHALLLAHLEANPPARDGRKRLMIEIGTTREAVLEQGSTEKLAARCFDLGIDFITVDMDPYNTRRAQRMFRRLGFPFRAITAKGEDFLAETREVIDYCFLDAYDFDHGNHTEIRQGRYESFLGSRISDEACHKMHYDCATSLASKLAKGGVICFDDTWTDGDGNWTAKGTTAVPFLIENGFEVIEARNRAILLKRD